jgi:ABC-type multidrug transport system ATPase subunit
MNSAIRTEHLEKRFHRVEAVRNLNLEVPTGAIYALVGRTVPARQPRSRF